MARKTKPKKEIKIVIRPRQMTEKELDSEEPKEAEEKEAGSKDEKTASRRMSWPSKDPFQPRVQEAGVKAASPQDEEEEVFPASEAGPKPIRRIPEDQTLQKRLFNWRLWRARLSGFRRSLPSLSVPLLPVVALLIIFVILFSSFFSGWSYDRGLADGYRFSEEAATKEKRQLPPEAEDELNTALAELRKGETASALDRLLRLEKTPHAYSSLTYLVALAAMQNGDVKLAETKVRDTIIKRERVSDALALQSVLVTQQAADPTRATMGDPKVRSEALLRQAAIADAANPYPHFELATLLRYQGKSAEAIKEIKAAQVRLNPFDSHLVMDITLALMQLEQAPSEKLPASQPETDDVRKLFPAAYVSMRRGDFAAAAALLQKCRASLPPDFFDYLVYDPAFRKFRERPELEPFFGN